MALTVKDLTFLQLAMAKLSGSAKAQLRAFFDSLDLSKPDLARDALLEFLPALASQYGDAAAAVAAEWFEDTVGARATMALADTSAAAGNVRYAAGKLWTPSPAEAFGLLATSLDKLVKQPSRDTVKASSVANGLRYARVPRGAKTCAFCLMLASRDAVYLTRKSAGDMGSGLGDSYHGDCNCAVMPVKPGGPLPDGYDPDSYYEIYRAAADAAGTTSDPRAVTAAIRRGFPDLVRG